MRCVGPPTAGVSFHATKAVFVQIRAKQVPIASVALCFLGPAVEPSCHVAHVTASASPSAGASASTSPTSSPSPGVSLLCIASRSGPRYSWTFWAVHSVWPSVDTFCYRRGMCHWGWVPLRADRHQNGTWPRFDHAFGNVSFALQ